MADLQSRKARVKRFTELLVQYGQGGEALFESCAEKLQATEDRVRVTGFALDKSGLGRYMREAKGDGKELKEHHKGPTQRRNCVDDATASVPRANKSRCRPTICAYDCSY